MNNLNSMITHINTSFDNANNNHSKCVKEILEMDGMSGKKTRHFYNNICSVKGIRYLEIGTWKGSSICSSMCNNNITCVAIDNWSEFGGPREDFLINFNKFKVNNNATFIENNCWEVDTSKLFQFNIYMYDGDHNTDSHYKALNYYINCLDNIFIYIVDDWNWDYIRNFTYKAIEDNKLNILFTKEILTPTHDGHVAIVSGPESDWHNGIVVFILEKSNNN